MKIFRFNLYDRAPISTLDSAEEMRKYYIALQKFSRLILGGKYEIKITLEKGVVIIIDNWRILHGRTAFTGQRHMTGCYVGRTDWLSSARVLGLI
jgi:alpha-ketoglutarate-dependent taurine dioxygenase